MVSRSPASRIPRFVPVRPETGIRRDIGKIGMLFTGVGSIIGSGWLFGAFDAARLAGPAAILSWVIGAIMVMAIALSYAELGAMFPFSGGAVRYPHYTCGSFASFTIGWSNWISVVATVPLEVMAAIQYTTAYIPWMMHPVDGVLVLTLPGVLIGIALLFVFSIINILGAQLFAALNSTMVWWKLGVIVLVGIVLMVAQFNFGHFHLDAYGGFLPFGFDEVFVALPAAGVVFSYMGFRSVVEFAGESDDPGSNIPFAVIGSLVLAAIIYILLQVAFIAAIPSSLLATGWGGLSFVNQAGPLAEVALLLGVTWLAIVLYVDAVVSPLDTGFVYSALTPRMMYSQAKLGNVPGALARLNSKGVPWISVFITFVVGCFMFLPFPSWSKIVGFVTSAAVIVFATGPISVACLRRELPDQRRPFRIPGGDVIPFLGFLFANLVLYWSGWSINWKMYIFIVIGYVVLIGYYMFAKDRSKIPPLNFKASWWMVLWFAGSALLSYLGHYGGGQDVLVYGWGELAVAVFSLIVFYIAIATRLTPIEVVEHVERTYDIDDEESVGKGEEDPA